MEPKLDHRLSGLLALDESVAEPWSDNDLRQMVQHQMRSPLVVDLSETGELEAMGDALAAVDSFEALFACEEPPLGLLVLTKNFAKGSLGPHPGPLPREIAHLLYYLSIATARVRLGERISGLSDDQMIDGLSWCLERAWIEGAIRDELGHCLALL